MILALETAGQVTHAWLYPSPTATTSPLPTSLAELEWDSGRNLSTELLGRLNDLVRDHQASLNDLTGIIIFSGPGSFTSLRIGHATANALADSLGIPVVGAQGEDWRQEAYLQLKTTPPGRPALPHYGAEANITKRKS